jgi:hypothetical protein
MENQAPAAPLALVPANAQPILPLAEMDIPAHAIAIHCALSDLLAQLRTRSPEDAEVRETMERSKALLDETLPEHQRHVQAVREDALNKITPPGYVLRRLRDELDRAYSGAGALLSTPNVTVPADLLDKLLARLEPQP